MSDDILELLKELGKRSVGSSPVQAAHELLPLTEEGPCRELLQMITGTPEERDVAVDVMKMALTMRGAGIPKGFKLRRRKLSTERYRLLVLNGVEWALNQAAKKGHAEANHQKAKAMLEVELLKEKFNDVFLTERPIKSLNLRFCLRLAEMGELGAKMAQKHLQETPEELELNWLMRQWYPYRPLAWAIWCTKVQPTLAGQLEREVKPVPTSTHVTSLLMKARHEGGTILDGLIKVECHERVKMKDNRQDKLMLQMDLFGDDNPIEATDGLVHLRKILSLEHIRTYYILLGLWYTQGHKTSGEFELENGLNSVLGYISRGNRAYYKTEARDMVQKHLNDFDRMRLYLLNDESMGETPDALVAPKKRRGRVLKYLHSRLVADNTAIRGSFLLVPRPVYNLNVIDFCTGVGISSVARAKAVTAMRRGKTIGAPIREWLEGTAADFRKAKKDPKTFWDTETKRLIRVANDGEIGSMEVVDGRGAEAYLELNLAPNLRDPYASIGTSYRRK